MTIRESRHVELKENPTSGGNIIGESSRQYPNKKRGVPITKARNEGAEKASKSAVTGLG